MFHRMPQNQTTIKIYTVNSNVIIMLHAESIYLRIKKWYYVRLIWWRKLSFIKFMIKKEKYSPSNLPLGIMMLTGGLAGSIAEVLTTLFRFSPSHSIQPRLDCRFRVELVLRLSTAECFTALALSPKTKAPCLCLRASQLGCKDRWSSQVSE